MKTIIWLVVGALIFLFLIDQAQENGTSAQIAAERTERTKLEQTERTQRLQIEESAQTERTYITAQQLMWLATERESTMRLMLLVALIFLSLTVIAGVVVSSVLVLSSQVGNKLPPTQPMRRMEKQGYRLEWDNREGWIAVFPNEQEYYTEADVIRLEQMTRIPPNKFLS